MKILVLGALALGLALPVQSANVAQALCEYVAADDKKRMRSFLKTNKLKIRRVFDSVQCNGKNLLEFADSKGSLDTGDMMISKLPKKTVTSIVGNLENTHLIISANNRIK